MIQSGITFGASPYLWRKDVGTTSYSQMA